MMPRKSQNEKRSNIIGVKVDISTREKLNYLAGMKGEKLSTYIYNLLLNHIQDKEPWITKEIEDMRKETQ